VDGLKVKNSSEESPGGDPDPTPTGDQGAAARDQGPPVEGGDRGSSQPAAGERAQEGWCSVSGADPPSLLLVLLLALALRRRPTGRRR
jgi:MYXO-CTERM domain-containing protein